MSEPTTLQEWVDQSPNASPNNTLIETIGLNKNRHVVYYAYGWNLRHVDPNEKAVYVNPSGNTIPAEEAIALLDTPYYED